MLAKKCDTCGNLYESYDMIDNREMNGVYIISKDKFGVNVEFEPKENNYVWTITASTCKNVAYFNIERDDTDKHWARCCVIDCSEL